jgi:type VI protein secretion system component VasF
MAVELNPDEASYFGFGGSSDSQDYFSSLLGAGSKYLSGEQATNAARLSAKQQLAAAQIQTAGQKTALALLIGGAVLIVVLVLIFRRKG